MLAAYLAGNPAVVSAALPEAPAVVCDVTNQLVLVGKVHLPDEGPVTKHPHFSEPWLLPRLESRTAADASNRLLKAAQARWPRVRRKAHWGCGLPDPFQSFYEPTDLFCLGKSRGGAGWENYITHNSSETSDTKVGAVPPPPVFFFPLREWVKEKA